MTDKPDLIDWQTKLGPIGPRTLPELIRDLIASARADAELLAAWGIPSNLEALEAEVARRRDKIDAGRVPGLALSGNKELGFLGILELVLDGIEAYNARPLQNSDFKGKR
jgi:hypothetical protein